MVKLDRVTRSYSGVLALDALSLEITQGEFVTVTGPSGCGKSTLLNLLGGLDRPDSGEIFVDALPLHNAGDAALTDYRRHRLGIVFQFFNLLPAMTVVENVELPLLFAGTPRRTMRERSLAMLDLVGLSSRAGHFPHQLSGGEMQRAAIARAIVHEPALLLADEPTGNLDSANAGRVMEALLKIASQRLATMVVVTHSEAVAEMAPRRIRLLDGRITHG
ncbi:MAG: ABC transporter ATP-binding protein [Chthoniobacterales bacterium]